VIAGPAVRSIANVRESQRWTAGSDRKLSAYSRRCRAGGAASGSAGDIQPEAVQQLDSVDAIGDLRKVGQAVAEQVVAAGHFAGFVP
jgi:hypothetical protein